MIGEAVDGVPLILYIGLSGALFLIGLLGVMIRRNPLLLLLSVELLLNSANLSLVAFSRYWNVSDGQVFALVVMVVAATEVVIGLGLVVAVFRQRMALDVDQIGGRRVKPLGEESREIEGDLGVQAEEHGRVFRCPHRNLGPCTHGRGMRRVEKYRHFAEHRAGVRDRRHRGDSGRGNAARI